MKKVVLPAICPRCGQQLYISKEHYDYEAICVECGYSKTGTGDADGFIVKEIVCPGYGVCNSRSKKNGTQQVSFVEQLTQDDAKSYFSKFCSNQARGSGVTLTWWNPETEQLDQLVDTTL